MRVIDLFCGCGGFTLGLQNAGFDVVVGIDNWTPALDVYRANFGHLALPLDLNDVDDVVDACLAFELSDVDMIVGGPPCQDFSQANRTVNRGERSSLTTSFAEVIDTIRPTWFIMENVRQIEKSSEYLAAVKMFHSAGYGLSKVILDASLCGVPQKRIRLFLIGELNGSDGMLESYLYANLASKPLTVRQYLNDSLGVDCYWQQPRIYNKQAVYSVHEPAPCIRGQNRPIPEHYYHERGNDDARSIFSIDESSASIRGQNHGIPEHYYHKPVDVTNRRVFSIDEPSRTIHHNVSAVPKSYKGHPRDAAPLTRDVRSLTSVERSWIQTFPPDFRWGDTCKTHLDQMIGNAVPPKLAEYVGNAIQTYLGDKMRGENSVPVQLALF